ncbi:MAG: YheT family hydrolase [Pirellulales bacterium]
MTSIDLPPFLPHRLLRGGHAQTLAGAYLPFRSPGYHAQHVEVMLADGDRLVLHDDCPGTWRPHDRSALLIHGLGGSHASGYMVRLAHKLRQRGVRVFRMDLRGCGAGVELARLPYHSGRSEDAAAAIGALAERLPHSPVTLVGFSLGANIVLKLLGELGEAPCGNLDSAMAVCPPVDLAACSRKIGRPTNRLYDRYFVRVLLAQLEHRARARHDAVQATFARRPRSLWEFDNEFTAVVCGFGTADKYYEQASSAAWLPRIRLPTLVVAARDDPMVECNPLERAGASHSVQVHLTEHGGHLGFIGRSGVDPDRRWMEWRVVDWVTQSRTPVVADLQRPGVER